MQQPSTSGDSTRSAPLSDQSTISTVSFVSLGCPKNLVDSETMLGMLAADGLVPVSADATDDPEHDGPAHDGPEQDDLSAAGSEQDASAAAGRVTPADAVVINTCGFLEASKLESVSVIREAVEAKARGEVKRVVVAGCLVQRHRAKLLDWAPGVDAMVGVFDRDKVVEAVRGAAPVRATDQEVAEAGPRYWIAGNALAKAEREGLAVQGLTVNGKDGTGLGYRESDAARLRLTPRHYAYLRISEGCNQACAFCTIPSIRGKMRSKAEHAVVAEARELMRDGAFELLLIGQDTTSYGDDVGVGISQGGEGLPGLLRSLSDAMSEEIGRGWLRLMYAYPTTFSDAMVEAFAELAQRGRLLPYLDIPLQHASDGMLAAMRRHVSAQQQLDLMLKLRERVPGMALRTTLISGFPGETDEDHAELLEFIEEVGFDAVGVFAFSPEPGTPAARLDADPALHVPDEIKAQRRGEVLELQQRLAFEQAEYVAEQFDPANPLETGCRFEVLIDGRSEPTDVEGPGHLARGRAYFQAPKIDASTFVASRAPLAPGELVECVITASEGYDLIARPVAEFERVASLPVLGGVSS